MWTTQPAPLLLSHNALFRRHAMITVTCDVTGRYDYNRKQSPMLLIQTTERERMHCEDVTSEAADTCVLTVNE